MALVSVYNAMVQIQNFSCQRKYADVIFIPYPNKNLTFHQYYRLAFGQLLAK